MTANPSLEDIVKNAKISEPTPLENSVREVISGTLREVTITMESFSINRIQKSASVTFVVNCQNKGLITSSSRLALDLILRVRAENIILGMGIHDALMYDIEMSMK